MALSPSASLPPSAGPLPATALIITSYYLGGPIIDSWAVGKRATQLQKLSRRPLFQVRWNFIGARLPRPEMHRAGRTSRDSRWNQLSGSCGNGTMRKPEYKERKSGRNRHQAYGPCGERLSAEGILAR